MNLSMTIFVFLALPLKQLTTAFTFSFVFLLAAVFNTWNNPALFPNYLSEASL